MRDLWHNHSPQNSHCYRELSLNKCGQQLEVDLTFDAILLNYWLLHNILMSKTVHKSPHNAEGVELPGTQRIHTLNVMTFK